MAASNTLSYKDRAIIRIRHFEHINVFNMMSLFKQFETQYEIILINIYTQALVNSHCCC